MLHSLSPSVMQGLAALRTEYEKGLLERLHIIEQEWQAIQIQPDDEYHYHTLYRLVHNLAGNGATFGFPMLSISARHLEQLLWQILEQQTFNTVQQTEMARAFENMHLAVTTSIGEIASESLTSCVFHETIELYLDLDR